MLKFSKIQEIIPEKEISLLKKISDMGHEDIRFCTDTETNLKAIIAVHSTKLGPGLGGCRMWNYENNLANFISREDLGCGCGEAGHS